MRGISKNKIVLGADVQRTQLQKYCQNRVARVDLGVPYAYGILGQQRLDGEWKTVAMIAPFSNDSAATAHLARLCTGQQLEPIHILDVIHDFMNTEARTL